MVKEAETESLSHYLQRIADADERRGDEASIVSSIYNEAGKAGFHKAALRLVFRLRKMPTAQRNDYLRAFDDYRTEAHLDEQPDMLEAKS